jgi:hypothetical protein
MNVVSTVEILASVFTAIGTVVVAVLAIWGDWFKDRLAGPKLELSLRDPRGDLTQRNDGKREIYYHLEVTNRRSWSLAQQVRVIVVGLAKRRPDGEFFPESMILPMQLTWAFPTFHEMLPTISKNDICDLGFVTEGAGQFRLSVYIWPNNCRGFLNAGEAMRVKIVAMAHNGQSTPIVLEISWDGTWSADREEMQRHLVVKETFIY